VIELLESGVRIIRGSELIHRGPIKKQDTKTLNYQLLLGMYLTTK